MTYNPDKAFDLTDDGLIIEEGSHVISGALSPVGVITPLVATYYLRNNGEIWFNPGSSDWVLVNDGHYSYRLVDSGQNIKIKQGQQMIVDGQVRVLGHMVVLGELVDISARKKEQFFYEVVRENDVVVVEADRLLMYKKHISVLGHLRVKGSLAGV